MPGRALSHQLIQLLTDTRNKSNIGFCTTPIAFLCSGKRQCNRIVIHDLKNRKHKNPIQTGAISQMCVHNNANGVIAHVPENKRK